MDGREQMIGVTTLRKVSKRHTGAAEKTGMATK
jgi:hypothetical protein